MPRIFFEDFTPGETTTSGRRVIEAEEIKAFARDYDPQPFHLDEAAGRASLLGGLAASGWHSASLMMRMIYDGWLNEAASLGSPGIEQMRWLAPVRPGDALSLRRTILDARPLASRPGMGVVRFAFELVDQTGATLVTQRNPILFSRRGAAGPAPGHYDRAPHGGGFTPPPLLPAAAFPLVYEEMEPEAEAYLGVWRVGRDEVVDFARAYDPQPFHLDETAAAASPFGRLAASGWQTVSQWMRRMVDARAASAAARAARGEPAPDGGPSPGYEDLKWPRPVYVGDEVHYTTRCLSRRRTLRPGWGVATFINRGVNQHGDLVLEFKASAFTPIAAPAA